jgi:tetrahydromethanopterin S-methyltransferase subunit E
MVLTESTYQLASFGGTVFLCFLVVVVGSVVSICNFKAPWGLDMIRDHYAAIVGLPSAAAAAFIIVTLFRQVVAEPIKLGALGLTVEGAGGPVLLWVICFMALAIALRMIWPLKP